MTHDTLALGFAAIVMLLESGTDRHVALAKRTARDDLAGTRALIDALTPPALDGLTLAEALRRPATDSGLPVEHRRRRRRDAGGARCCTATRRVRMGADFHSL
ncbi:hypothetical protein ACTMTF_09795 [Nonomuraea sp. ZG12]|uniref:hypothetical protein n=1 Tax=Nonomuraea sp. ZG12 TaxID=3452207 RepID=UPI003F89695E